MTDDTRPAFVVIRYRDPDHEIQTIIYQFRGEKTGEHALQEENRWQTDRLRRLAEVHVRRADSIFDLLAQNESLFVEREAVAG